MSISLIAILYLLGTAQGVFLSIALLISRTGNSLANRYLAALTLVFCLALTDYFLDINYLAAQYLSLTILIWPKEYLYGILIYFYVRELTLPGKFKLAGRQWLHFVPFFLHVLVSWSLFWFSPERQFNILNDTAGLSAPDDMYAFILSDGELYTTVVQLSIYFILCFRLLEQHRCRIGQAFSYTDKISLNWLRVLLLGLVVVYFIWLAEEFISLDADGNNILDAALGLSMVVLIYTMGLIGLRQSQVFNSNRLVDAIVCEPPTVLENPEDNSVEKYQNSPISNELGESLIADIRSYMDKERPYLDAELSLPILANKLDMPLNYLSQIINEQAGENFFDFVNRYRVEAAKSRLTEDKENRVNILTIALDSGFNSKSTFYSSFKKYTGMTPGAYRKTK